MKATASGAANARAFNPEHDLHYAAPEDSVHELQTLFSAIETMGILVSHFDPQRVNELEVQQLGAVFQTFASHGQRLTGAAVFVRPKSTPHH